MFHRIVFVRKKILRAPTLQNSLLEALITKSRDAFHMALIVGQQTIYDIINQFPNSLQATVAYVRSVRE